MIYAPLNQFGCHADHSARLAVLATLLTVEAATVEAVIYVMLCLVDAMRWMIEATRRFDPTLILL